MMTRVTLARLKACKCVSMAVITWPGASSGGDPRSMPSGIISLLQAIEPSREPRPAAGNTPINSFVRLMVDSPLPRALNTSPCTLGIPYDRAGRSVTEEAIVACVVNGGRRCDNARHSFLKNTGEEAVEAEGLLASLADDDLIVSQAVGIVGLEQMRAKEELEELSPRERRSKEALDGAVASAGLTPASDAGHGDATGHRQKRQGDVVEVAQRGWCENRVETGEQC